MAPKSDNRSGYGNGYLSRLPRPWTIGIVSGQVHDEHYKWSCCLLTWVCYGERLQKCVWRRMRDNRRKAKGFLGQSVHTKKLIRSFYPSPYCSLFFVLSRLCYSLWASEEEENVISIGQELQERIHLGENYLRLCWHIVYNHPRTCQDSSNLRS